MNELNEEIKLTLNIMQTDIDDAAHNELQGHLYSLLEIKRNELQQRLVERSWSEPVTHDEAKPLTTEEIMAGGWWCADVSEECRLAFTDSGVGVACNRWDENANVQCAYKSNSEKNVLLAHVAVDLDTLKQIHRVGNYFYWSEK